MLLQPSKQPKEQSASASLGKDLEKEIPFRNVLSPFLARPVAALGH